MIPPANLTEEDQDEDENSRAGLGNTTANGSDAGKGRAIKFSVRDTRLDPRSQTGKTSLNNELDST